MRNNKFFPDAVLSTTHNWRPRSRGWPGEPCPTPRSTPSPVRPPLSPPRRWISSHSLYAVIARPGGDIGVRMDRHKGMRLFTLRPPAPGPLFALSYQYIRCVCAAVLLLVQPFHFPPPSAAPPATPCTIPYARSFYAMETRETLYGRGWPEKLRETATEELLILGSGVSAWISCSDRGPPVNGIASLLRGD